MSTLVVARLMPPTTQLTKALGPLSLTPGGAPWELTVTLFACRQQINPRVLEQVTRDQRLAPLLVMLRVHPLAVLGPTTVRSATDGCILRALPALEGLRKRLGEKLGSYLPRDRVLTTQPMPQILYGPIPEMSRKRLCLDRLELRHVAEA